MVSAADGAHFIDASFYWKNWYIAKMSPGTKFHKSRRVNFMTIWAFFFFAEVAFMFCKNKGSVTIGIHLLLLSESVHKFSDAGVVIREVLLRIDN